jgi:hypothetical protein
MLIRTLTTLRGRSRRIRRRIGGNADVFGAGFGSGLAAMALGGDADECTVANRRRVAAHEEKEGDLGEGRPSGQGHNERRAREGVREQASESERGSEGGSERKKERVGRGGGGGPERERGK